MIMNAHSPSTTLSRSPLTNTPLSRTPRWFYVAVILMGTLVLALGAWWLYLLSHFADQALISSVEDERLWRMLKWEGSTFIVLLLFFAGALLYLHSRDLAKSRALQALFATLTHELKTPLASMRLQAEVLSEKMEDYLSSEKNEKAQKIKTLLERLILDGLYLESELDKGLQLSRVEQGGGYPLTEVDLLRLFKREYQQFAPHLTLNWNPENVPESLIVMADESALKMVWRNLLQNTLRHHSSPSKITLHWEIDEKKSTLLLSYEDFGKPFTGELNQLGKLFYKHESRKGSGVGLYLVRELMQAMQGRLHIQAKPHLVFELTFKLRQFTENDSASYSSKKFFT
jgi:signal transduction histidine kinase